MWLVTIDGAPQRIDVASLRGSWHRAVWVNGEMISDDRWLKSAEPAQFEIGTVPCSVHTVGALHMPRNFALFVNGQRIEPHVDHSTALSRSTSAAVAATSLGTAKVTRTVAGSWTFAMRVDQFWLDVRGTIRITQERFEFAGWRPKDDVAFPLTHVVRVLKSWSLLFPVYTVSMRDGRELKFLTEAKTFATLLNGKKEWRP
jgi:hypothetical protein